MLEDKKQIFQMLREEFDRWEALLASQNEEQIVDPKLPSELSIKDVIAHLSSWQQISLARMEAGRDNKEPELPDWLESLDPDSEENLEAINARIHETNLQKPWREVYADWRDGYLHLMELGEALSEEELLDKGRYPWLNGYSLADVLLGWYDHHHEEHYIPLSSYLHESENHKPGG